MSSQISLNSIILNVNTPSHNISQLDGSLNSSQVTGFSPAHVTNNTSRTRVTISPLNDLGTGPEHGTRNIQHAESNTPSATLACPSPDEIIIKGRGRRSLPVKWSPIPIESPQKLPLNSVALRRSPKKGIITLRSSPRKRLQLSDPVAEEVQLANSRKALLHSSPLLRKQNESHTANYQSTMETTIKKMAQKDLVDILTTIIKTHPEIKDEIGNYLPKPVLKHAEEKLKEITEAIKEMLPSAKTDSASFCKVIPQLSAMKQFISEQCQHLESLENWNILLEFVFLSWMYVRELPNWDSEIHQNYARNPCFKILAHHALVALKHLHIKQKDSQYVESLYEKFEERAADHKDVQPCVKLLQMFRRS